MAEEKILKDAELIEDEQLEQVAGGTYGQTFDDMDFIKDHTGIRFHGSDSDKREQLRELFRQNGIKLKDHGGFTPNEYFVLDQDGNKKYETTQDGARRYVVEKILGRPI